MPWTEVAQKQSGNSNHAANDNKQIQTISWSECLEWHALHRYNTRVESRRRNKMEREKRSQSLEHKFSTPICVARRYAKDKTPYLFEYVLECAYVGNTKLSTELRWHDYKQNHIDSEPMCLSVISRHGIYGPEAMMTYNDITNAKHISTRRHTKFLNETPQQYHDFISHRTPLVWPHCQ